MGTRSITIVNNEDGDNLLVMYRQMDGYPTGHGQELVDFLTDMHIVNGISLTDDQSGANGMGCLAAQLVAHFKEGIGEIYLLPANANEEGIDYVYELRPPASDRDYYTGMADELRLVVRDFGETIFDGPVVEFGVALKDKKF